MTLFTVLNDPYVTIICNADHTSIDWMAADKKTKISDVTHNHVMTASHLLLLVAMQHSTLKLAVPSKQRTTIISL